MNQAELLKRLEEFEDRLLQTKGQMKKVRSELEKNDQIRTKLLDATRVEHDADGNAEAIADLDGQERRLLMPLVKADANQYVVRFQSRLIEQGICLDEIEEWFEQQGIVYYWLTKAVMPIAAGFIWEVENWRGSCYMVGDTPRHLVTLLFDSIPHLFPEFRYGEVADALHRQYTVFAQEEKMLKNEIRRFKTQLKRLAAAEPLSQLPLLALLESAIVQSSS